MDLNSQIFSIFLCFNKSKLWYSYKGCIDVQRLKGKALSYTCGNTSVLRIQANKAYLSGFGLHMINSMALRV